MDKAKFEELLSALVDKALEDLNQDDVIKSLESIVHDIREGMYAAL